MALAAASGVTTLAVTDHDTLDGVAEAQAAGERAGVAIVPGIELSVRAPSGSMHLLGYFPTAAPEPLLERLAALREERRRRAEAIVARLAALGVPVRLADVAARARGPIGRPHIADALIDAGHAHDRRDAFERFLADGAPAHVPHAGLLPEAAIRLVLASGGAPVLAHPASLRMDGRALRAFVGRLASLGLAGIEVHRPDHTPERRAGLARLADDLGLVACGGSDFHRPGDGVVPGDTGDPPLPPGTLVRLLPGSEGVSGSVGS